MSSTPSPISMKKGIYVRSTEPTSLYLRLLRLYVRPFQSLVALFIISVVSIAILSSHIQLVSIHGGESSIIDEPRNNNNNNNAPGVLFSPPTPNTEMVDNATATVMVAHPITIRSDSKKESTSNPPPTIDWTDSIFTRIRGGWDNEPIVLESHKLLFFSVPKVGCTNFKQLARRMMNYSDWATASPHDPRTNRLKYLGDYSKQEQELFMTSPDWTRAVFVRDPKQRVLSAYMEKALAASRWNVTGAYIKRKCCHILPRENDMERRQEKVKLRRMALTDGQVNLRQMHETCANTLTPYEEPTTSETFQFSTFVERFMRQCDDPHWRPQFRRLSPRNWQFINFVGYLETVQDDARRLLERIGAYEEFGAHGWGKGNQSLFQSNIASHKTSSTSHTDTHFDSSLVEGLVYQYYREDYEHPVMNFTKPANFEQILLEMSEKKTNEATTQ